MHSLQRKARNCRIDSSNCHFCQSAQYQRSSRGFVQRIRSDSRKQTEGEVGGSRVVPTEIANANATPLSSTSLAQANLLQEYEQKFAERPDDQKLSKLCSDAGFLQEIGKGQFFIALEEESEVMQYVESTHREWTRSNTKIGPVLDVKLHPHEGRYCFDIMIESLFRDQAVSWVRIVN